MAPYLCRRIPPGRSFQSSPSSASCSVALCRWKTEPEIDKDPKRILTRATTGQKWIKTSPTELNKTHRKTRIQLEAHSLGTARLQTELGYCIENPLRCIKAATRPHTHKYRAAVHGRRHVRASILVGRPVASLTMMVCLASHWNDGTASASEATQSQWKPSALRLSCDKLSTPQPSGCVPAWDTNDKP